MPGPAWMGGVLADSVQAERMVNAFVEAWAFVRAHTKQQRNLLKETALETTHSSLGGCEYLLYKAVAKYFLTGQKTSCPSLHVSVWREP